MFLTTEEEQSLQGENGEAIQLAMSVLVKLGEMYGADRMIQIENVHVDASSYYGISDAGMEFVEKLAGTGATYKVPTTLCIASIDFESCSEFGVSEECVEKQLRIAQAHSTMGADPTWTCAPYQCGSSVEFGQRIAWGESNAIAFVNSVIGARTIRCADFVDICAAIAGLMPEFGLYLDDERKGSILVRLEDLDTRQFTSADYAALGYYVGGVADSLVPVLEGVSKSVSVDQLKAFSAAASTSGSIGLFHISEITPEAKNLDEAFGGEKPSETVIFGEDELREARHSLATQDGADPEIAILGCPHYSVEELDEVARILKNKQVSPDKQLWVFTNKCGKQESDKKGILEKIAESGAKVICDTCFILFPTPAWELGSIATDSAKMAHYAPGLGDFCVSFLDKEQCIESVTK
ncbi:MAG: aconitase X catalytic domain-containing protein [Candidatus Thorarchaeota archaeon]|nr:MAG: aconitase X catalytic domain-containing protein [Candidatus Thorarchaeota archaeon]